MHPAGDEYEFHIYIFLFVISLGTLAIFSRVATFFIFYYYHYYKVVVMVVGDLNMRNVNITVLSFHFR